MSLPFLTVAKNFPVPRCGPSRRGPLRSDWPSAGPRILLAACVSMSAEVAHEPVVETNGWHVLS
jgi:hypothetical protein